MIDFQLTDAQNNIQGMLHWFAESEMRPVSLQADREHKVPDELLQKTIQYGISMADLVTLARVENVNRPAGTRTIVRSNSCAS